MGTSEAVTRGLRFRGVTSGRPVGGSYFDNSFGDFCYEIVPLGALSLEEYEF